MTDDNDIGAPSLEDVEGRTMWNVTAECNRCGFEHRWAERRFAQRRTRLPERGIWLIEIEVEEFISRPERCLGCDRSFWDTVREDGLIWGASAILIETDRES